MRGSAAIEQTRDFAAGRQVDHHGERLDGRGSMNRLYVVETSCTVAGGIANQRSAVRSADLAMMLSEELAKARDVVRRTFQQFQGDQDSETLRRRVFHDDDVEDRGIRHPRAARPAT